MSLARIIAYPPLLSAFIASISSSVLAWSNQIVHCRVTRDEQRVQYLEKVLQQAKLGKSPLIAVTMSRKARIMSIQHRLRRSDGDTDKFVPGLRDWTCSHGTYWVELGRDYGELPI
jgi:hypothetical protein